MKIHLFRFEDLQYLNTVKIPFWLQVASLDNIK